MATEEKGIINTCAPNNSKDYRVEGGKVIPTGAPKVLGVTEITPKVEREARGGFLPKNKPTMSSTFETVI